MISLQPQSKFLKTDQAKRHADLVMTDSFHELLTIALAQMQLNLPSSENPARSWDNQNKMEGAKEFIRTLLNLAEPPKPRSELPQKQLNPNPTLRKKD